MAPIQRPIHIKNLFVEIVKCFKKAGDEEILESMQRTHEICHEISLYANDMTKAGRIVGCPVSFKSLYVTFLLAYVKFSLLKNPKQFCDVCNKNNAQSLRSIQN